MTNLGTSMLQLRAAWNLALTELDGRDRDQEAINLAERLAEQLLPESLAIQSVQETIAHLVRGLPRGRWVLAWRSRLAVHLFHLGVNVDEPLFSLLYDLEQVGVPA